MAESWMLQLTLIQLHEITVIKLKKAYPNVEFSQVIQCLYLGICTTLVMRLQTYLHIRANILSRVWSCSCKVLWHWLKMLQWKGWSGKLPLFFKKARISPLRQVQSIFPGNCGSTLCY